VPAPPKRVPSKQAVVASACPTLWGEGAVEDGPGERRAPSLWVLGQPRHVLAGGCFAPRCCRDPQQCPGGDAGVAGQPRLPPRCREWLSCEWIWSVAMLKGGDTGCLRRSFLEGCCRWCWWLLPWRQRVERGTPRCDLLRAWPGAVPSPCRTWEGCAVPTGGRGRGCSDPCHPHQAVLIHQLSCTSQASFNVACLSLFELLFGIKQNNQRFVMFPALNGITRLKKQLKYLWLALFCVQCTGVNAK